MTTVLARWRKAVRESPNSTELRLELARALTMSGQQKEAARGYNAILMRDPKNVIALRELCWLFGSVREFDSAEAVLDRLHAAGSDVAPELAQLALARMSICDWRSLPKLTDRLRQRLGTAAPCLINPYAVFGISDNPEDHLLVARCVASAISSHTKEMRHKYRKVTRTESGRSKLKIGYLCGDFKNHPTALLTAGILENHDHGRFEITIYDYSPEDGSAIRERILRAVPRLIKLGSEGPAESASRIASDEIDVLVDLKGYTDRTRSEIMALRPAHIQVSFLGFGPINGIPESAEA